MAAHVLYDSLLDLTGPEPVRRWALVAGDSLISSGQGDSWRQIPEVISGQADYQDASDLVLAPAFTDIHCHGGGGVAFDDATDLEPALQVHGSAGTGQLVASLVSNPLTDMGASMRRLQPLLNQEGSGLAQVVGFHAEGPFISPLHKGAHDPTALRAPSPDAVQRLWEDSEGKLLHITLAPETDPQLATVRRCVELGIKVAVGHTDASYQQAKAAFDEGASLLTHTFNAMRPLHHRQPGPIAAALDTQHVTLELICDGVHVHAPMIRAAFSLAAGRVALITDAMAAAGCQDGPYHLGSLDVEVKNSIAHIAGTDTIAGSTLTLAQAVQEAVAFGIPLQDAVRAATSVPAAALGLETPKSTMLLLGADGALGQVLSR